MIADVTPDPNNARSVAAAAPPLDRGERNAQQRREFNGAEQPTVGIQRGVGLTVSIR